MPGFGNSQAGSELSLILQDLLADMGSVLTTEIGSLAWCEAVAVARALRAAQQFSKLLSNQLNATTMSVLQARYAVLYGLPNTPQLSETLLANQQIFGLEPTISNLTTYLQSTMDGTFIGLDFNYQMQPYATNSNISNGQSYLSPLSTLFVYIWQPRNNQDITLMPNNLFLQYSNSYQNIVDKWLPAYCDAVNLNLTNRGFEDGYGNNYNGLIYNNYNDGYNVISGTVSSNIITGTNTAFQLYPNGQVGDFSLPLSQGFLPPLQVVDDNNVLQTYTVASVQSNTQLTIVGNLVSNITNRAYRTLGVCMDQPGLDGVCLLNNGT
jgi:hypothetical protein